MINKIKSLHESKEIKSIPFIDQVSTIKSVLEEAEFEINYSEIELNKIIRFVMSFLEANDIEYTPIKLEFNEEIIDAFPTFDELESSYEFIKSLGHFDRMLDILDKEIELKIRQFIQVGLFESKILEVSQRAVTVIENISTTVTDKKKLGSILKTFTKEIPDLKGLFNKN